MSSRNPATVITVINRKGGVGKTHLCWLMASVAIERGKRMLVLDLDPQANITGSLLPQGFSGPGVEALFNSSTDADVRRLIRNSWHPNLDIVPASELLEPVNVSDSAVWEQSELQLAIAETLPQVATDYDYIVMDCPPSLSLTSIAALCASDFVIVPLEAAHWGALGTQHIAAAIDHVRSRYNDRIELLGYVVSRFKTRRSYQQSHLFQLLAHFGDDAFQTVIPDLAAFEKSVTDKVPITLHSHSSRAAQIAREFFDELESRCKRISRKRSRRSRGSVLDASHTVAG